MKTYSDLVVPDLTRQLVAAGFLVGEAQDTGTTRPVSPGPLISQVGGVTESAAFDLDCGYRTGYCVSLHVAVDLRAIAISGWKLDLPWPDPTFQWVPEPSEHVYSGNIYKVPGCQDLEFSRDSVLNHRRVVRRGGALDGLLLGFSHQSIPESYRHGAAIEAALVLIDEMDRNYSTPIQLWANRIAKIDPKRTKKSTRRQLVQNQYHPQDEPAPKWVSSERPRIDTDNGQLSRATELNGEGPNSGAAADRGHPKVLVPIRSSAIPTF